MTAFYAFVFMEAELKPTCFGLCNFAKMGVGNGGCILVVLEIIRRS